MTTIPYDTGWTVRVDGTEVTPRKILGAFLGVELTAGEHVLELDYMPDGLKNGAYISGISAAFIILSLVVTGAIRRRKRGQ